MYSGHLCRPGENFAKMNQKKPRSDSKIAALAPELRAEIARRLGEANQSYEDVSVWLAEDGHRISITALCNWYSIHSWKEHKGSAREVAEAVRAEAASSGDYDEATLALVKERAYILARTKGADVKDLATLAAIIGDSAKLRLKEREVALTERRILILEKKAARDDQTEGILKDGDLTEAEKAARLRGLFGMG